MKLRSIEAVRYGRLENTTLARLGDGLTVVLGPNEAGKSTYTALVRHILYGFPTPASVSDRPYLSQAGPRQGRLQFEDQDGTWVVQRIQGVRGGTVDVRSPSGEERPEALSRIVHGVSDTAYRVVFGFGLAEMAQIEELRGSGDDIISRLYAAGAGLAVSPQDVRKTVRDAAYELYAPKGSKPQVNVINAEIRAMKTELRALEEQSVRFADDRAALEVLIGEVEQLRARRDELAGVERGLERDVETMRSAESRLAELEPGLLDATTELSAHDRRLEALIPDAKVLAAAADLDLLAADLSAHRDRLARIDGIADRVEDFERAIQTQATGLGVVDPSSLALGVGLSSDVDDWRDRITRQEIRCEDAGHSDRSAAAAVAAGGLPTADRSSIPAYAMLGIGLLACVLGGVLGQYLALGVGVALVLAGAALLVMTRRAPAAPGGGSQAARFAEEHQRREAAALEQVRGEWRAWLAAHELSQAGGTPAAVSKWIAAAALLRTSVVERAALQGDLDRERQAAASYAARLATAIEAAMPQAGPVTGPKDAVAVALRAGEQLAAVRAISAERIAVLQQAGECRLRVEQLQARVAEAASAAAEVRVRRTLETDVLSTLEALLSAATAEAHEVAEQTDQAAERRAALSERLDIESRENRMGELRLRLAGLRERLSERVGSYLVLATAEKLLERAQERYERERQPEVVRIAGEVFSQVTEGRYTRISVPLDDGALTVFTAAGEAVAASALSCGTAEALYLAMRIGLIGQLGDVGDSLPVLMDDILVNFDPERRGGAASAIAGLSTQRQVVYFTCHPETVEVLRSADPGLTLLELGRCAL